MQVAAVHVHDVLLIAAPPVARGLEDEPSTVGAEVRFGILAAVGDLADVAEVRLAALGGDGRDGDRRGAHVAVGGA